MKVKIIGARLAFPVLFEPQQVNGEGDAKYGASLLVGPKRDVEVLVGEAVEGGGTRYTKKLKITDVIDHVGAAQQWKKGRTWAAVRKAMDAQDKSCLHDGDLKEKYSGFAGQYFLSTGAPVSARPTVVNAKGAPLTARDGVVYAGCYVIALVEIWAQDNEWGQRINAQLRGIQFLRDGESFGGGKPPADSGEFEDVSVGADADDIADELG